MKAGTDPDLAGSWKVVTGPSENIGRVRRFVDVGGAYYMSVLDGKGKPNETDP